MVANRNYAISYIRIIAMIMIICCHVLQFYGNFMAWWFNVGVQIFLLISGYLYGKKDIDNWILFVKKQYKKILLPYWIYLVFITIIYFLIARNLLSCSIVFKAIVASDQYKGLEHLWFIPYILFCYFLTPFLNELKHYLDNKSLHHTIIALIIICMMMEILGYCYNSYFKASRILCYLIGYFMSYLQDRIFIKNKEILKKYILIILSLGYFINIIRIFVKYYLTEYLTGTVKSLFGIYEEYAHIALGVAIFITLLVILKKSKETLASKLGDKYSYYIYITHHFFILSPFSLLYLNISWPIKVIIICVAICISAFLLEIISSKLSGIKNKKIYRRI